MRDGALNLYRESVLDTSRDLPAVRGLSTRRETGTRTLPPVMPTQLDVLASTRYHSALKTASSLSRSEEPLLLARNDVDTLRWTGLNSKGVELVSRSTKQVFEQFTQSHYRPRSLRNTESETKFRGNLPVPLCTSSVPTGQLC